MWCELCHFHCVCSYFICLTGHTPGHIEGCRAHTILDSGMASVPTLNSFLGEEETLCLSQYPCITQHSINNRNEIAHSNLGNLRIKWSRSVVSDSAIPWIAARQASCPSPSPGVHSNSHLSSWWCHQAISSSVVPFSSCSQSIPESGSFPMSQLFAWSGQSTGASALASFPPKNTQGPSLKWTGWISLLFKELSRVFSNTRVQKHKFFGAQLSTQSNSHIHTWPLEKP